MVSDFMKCCVFLKPLTWSFRTLFFVVVDSLNLHHCMSDCKRIRELEPKPLSPNSDYVSFCNCLCRDLVIVVIASASCYLYSSCCGCINLTWSCWCNDAIFVYDLIVLHVNRYWRNICWCLNKYIDSNIQYCYFVSVIMIYAIGNKDAYVSWDWYLY